MLISGIQQFTLLDYPDKIAAIVFTPGCQFRCGYCHNPEFVLPEKIIQLKNSFIPETAFFSFLENRKNMLDGVVVSGGEPTLAPDLLAFIKKIKDQGYLVKLDTNGSRPDILQKAITEKLIDYVALDLKTAWSDYKNLAGSLVNPEKIEASLNILKTNQVDYELRSTLLKEVHSDIILDKMKELARGAKRLFLQTFRPGITLSPAYSKFNPFSPDEMRAIAADFRAVVNFVKIRA